MRLFFLLSSFFLLLSAKSLNKEYNQGVSLYKQKNYIEAFQHFNNCRDDRYCQAMIALMYQKGEGLKKSIPLAKLWFESSSNQGELSSMHNLANLYFKEKNYKKAFYWFNKAAKEGEGYTPSIYNVGLFYLNGWGVDADLNEALRYIKKADQYNYPNAKKVLNYINEKLKHTQK